MKILFAVTPAISHLSPLLTVVRMVQDRGDEVPVATGTHLRAAVEATGARFLPLAPGADLDFSRIEVVLPGMHTLPPGPEQMRYALERVFLDPMPAQVATLRRAILDEVSDLVVTDSGFMGRAALFLDRSRPPVPLVALGFSLLSLDRPDGAPLGSGLPPARNDEERARYAAIGAEFDRVVAEPGRAYADEKLLALGLPPLPCSVLATLNLLADAYLHPTVRAFEYDYGPLPDHIRFVGALPPPPTRNVSRPDWWGELDDGRSVVLVTQGTVANADFSELVEPALAALAHREDLLVVVTTGGRPLDDIHGLIPGNARLAEFLDYGELLPKLSVLVTNGGYGTVSLSLRAGVPIVAAGRSEEKQMSGRGWRGRASASKSRRSGPAPTICVRPLSKSCQSLAIANEHRLSQPTWQQSTREPRSWVHSTDWSAVYRRLLMRHRVGAYAASAAGVTCPPRSAPPGGVGARIGSSLFNSLSAVKVTGADPRAVRPWSRPGERGLEAAGW